MPSAPNPPPGPKRAPSSPKVQGVELEADRIMGGADKQRRQDLPKRSATMPGMAALRAPPLFSQPEPEHPAAPTLPVPNPLQRQTIRRPTPPSAVAHARRTDPPAASDPPPTSVRVPRYETPLVSPREPSPLPPPSQRPGHAANAALRRRAEAAEAEVAEFRRRDRVAAETRSPNTFPPSITPASSPPPKPHHTTGPQGVQGRTGEQGAPASKLAQLPAALLGAAALITAIGTALRPAPDTKAAESYAAMREELVKQNAAIKMNGDSDEQHWNFTLGLFTAQGIKVTPQPGTPKVEPLVLEPAPLTHTISRSSAPAIQVRDPLPPPVPSVVPVQLPKDLASLPKTPP